jgi:hypothetical protein
VVRAIAITLCGLALLAATRGLVRHNTWYLASDQFAFLTFADDLTHGRVFHDPTTVGLLAGPSLPREAAADAYYQTYILRGGRLYSRYPPGYPLLLAGVKLAGGETAQHWLNPLLYLVLVGVLGRLAAHLVPSPAAAWAAAAAAMWALLVIPVEVHYWGITIARDLPAHLLALTAVLSARAGSPGWSGLLLGLAGSVRPDAVLWAPSVALVLPRDARRPGDVARGTIAFATGLLPLLAYNTVTQGHPLAFTQGSEFRGAFKSALGAGLLMGDASFVSGGGFRLIHFPTTFLAHARYLAAGFGGYLWLAMGMGIAGAIRGLPTTRALAAYVVIGLLFYSCWSHGDPRYLVGVSLSLIVLAAAATVTIADWLGDPRVPARVRVLGSIVAGGVLAFGAVLPGDPARGLSMLERAGAVAFLGAMLGAAMPGARAVARLLPALGFATFGVMRILTSSGGSEGFRAADIERARRAIEALVPPGAVVLTSPGLGRPAENWTHYAHVDAHYLGELDRLFSDANLVGYRCTAAGRPLYLLLGPADPLPFTLPRAFVSMREVARRNGDELRDWFVDPQRAAGGAILYEARVALTPPGS